MAPRQAKRNVAEVQRQLSFPKDQGEHHASLPAHRLTIDREAASRYQEEATANISSQERSPEGQEYRTKALSNQQLSRQTSMLLSFYYALKLTLAKSPQTLSAPLQAKDRKRKRSQESDDPRVHALAKRLQTSIAGLVVEATCIVTDDKTNPIDYWRKHGRWPKEYFKQDDQARENFKKDFEKGSWYEKYWIPEMNMNHLLAKKKSSSSLRSKQSEASSAGSSDQKPRDVKSALF